jgi:hypothetical protein
MVPRVVEAQYVRDYVIWLKFHDGVEGEVDLEDELWGEVFEPLKDQKVFQTVRVHPDLHTVVWENDADFAPEFLYERVIVAV